ncbi:MAG: hypothetical protein BGO12_13135 [Verrucomicrobia bacterium 61-8]|nr:MAG: hypothetical protein BGO12_13135 [Verrucomicrobia bacterium 61-8]
MMPFLRKRQVAQTGADGLRKESEAPDLRVGTLVYTRRGLLLLFIWLLTGDFLFSMMEMLQQRVLPVLLRAHDASDKEIAVIVSMIFGILSAVLNPVIGYVSDRTRTRWGRRIPFLIVATPLVTIFLAVLPYSPEIAEWLMEAPFTAKLLAWFPVRPLILVFGVLVTLFQIANAIILSVYYYLLRDVVPAGHLGRFMSLFRIFGIAAGFVFGFWIFGMVEAHSKGIFLGISLLYGLGFGAMCCFVKEGGYPPVEQAERAGGGLPGAIRNYAVQCFGAPIYRWIYLTRTALMVAWVSNTFLVFFLRDQIHLSLDTIGKIGAIGSLVVLPIAYPFGVLLDRWGSVRSMFLAMAGVLLALLGCFFFVRDWASFLLMSLLLALPIGLQSIGDIVLAQSLFHPQRMGQLCSANVLIWSLATVSAAPVCGAFFTWVHDYRYVYVWNAFFVALAIIAFIRVHHHWRKLGGPDHYSPPLPGAMCSTDLRVFSKRMESTQVNNQSNV